MWSLLFSIVLAVAVFLVAAAYMLRDRTKPTAETTSLDPENSESETKNGAEVSRRMVSQPMPGFDGALCRLRNMSEMMNRLGVDKAALTHGNFDIRSVFNACQGCVAGALCRDWLARAPKSIDRAPDFCVNAQHFAGVKQAA